MAARSRTFSGGRDLEKKDSFTLSRTNSHSILGRLKAFRRRRIVLALVALWIVYMFIKNMPQDLTPVPERYDRRYGRLRPDPPGVQGQQQQAQFQATDEQVYEGPILFYELADTLRNQATPRDYSKGDVLFAVSKLKSIPRVLPFACSMTQYNRSRVHLAFMGRQRAEWNDIRALNGIAETGCDITVHDARPNFPEQSSEGRLRFSATAALGHIHSSLKVGAVFVDEGEDQFIVSALKEKTSSLGISLITLPSGGFGSLSWMSSLDASSLSHLNNAHVEIVIQAQAESSASLLRLLRSIKDADYSGWAHPRITIELPAVIDPFLQRSLTQFRWPPNRAGSESKLVIRHRFDTTLMSPIQASVRTAESFYPLSPRESHVLFLSANAELSRSYFHFLMYLLLDYGYGSRHGELFEHLVGFSLDLPTQAPDLKTPAPWAAENLDEPVMLWQTPASNAALYFGDRWVEFHSFLSRRLLVDPELVKTIQASPTLSHRYPSWLQPMLEMMQVRGYYLMYPTFAQKDGSAVVTVHQELAQVPEEYLKEKEAGDEPPVDGLPRFKLGDDQALTADDEISRMTRQEQRVHSDSVVNSLLEAMHSREQKDGSTAGSDVPMFSFGGDRMTLESSQAGTRSLAEDFALSIGGCKTYSAARNGIDVEGMFCLAV